MDVERLLAEEAAGWRALRATFASIPVGRFTEPSVTPAGWSPKDVMHHVAAWLAEAGLQLERMRARTFDPKDDPSLATIEEMNATWFEIGRDLDPATVRAELESARVRMLQTWNELSEVTPEAWEWFEESGPIHYAEHAKDLRSWLERSEAPLA